MLWTFGEQSKECDLGWGNQYLIFHEDDITRVRYWMHVVFWGF
jgi:hypothetical protein